MEEFRESGLEQKAYAEKIGIKPGTLRSMLYRRSRRARRGFAAVEVTGPATSVGVVTIRSPQGVEVELPVTLGEASLRVLLRELLAPCLR